MSNVAGSDTLALQGPGDERHTVPFGGRFRVDHGIAAREASSPGAALHPPIGGLSTISWWLADSR
ncbi:LysR family transcriptional regulator [Rhizobium favelukesii]|uniref:LysR family transcriptional regulator n=1 Tax=Rhizobium favelukesii TaxID=348824 RepID=W6RBG6_9HYPH|nr:LysR family transcriptional regulator [Rhizobium favelukesii]